MKFWSLKSKPIFRQNFIIIQWDNTLLYDSAKDFARIGVNVFGN